MTNARKTVLRTCSAMLASFAFCAYAGAEDAKGAPSNEQAQAPISQPSNTAEQAYSHSPEKIGDVITVGSNAFMLVRVFDTPQKNDTFQRNVNIMRQYAQVISESKLKLEKIENPEEKAALQNKIKQLEDEFESNEKAMIKVYAFASNRQYRQVFLKTNICVPLTADELSNLRSASGMELDPLKIIERDGKNFYIMKKIDGAKANEELQKAIAFTLTRRAEADKLRVKLSETTDPTEQMDLTKKISLAEKALKQNEDELKEKYGLGNAKSYIIEVDLSKLYLVLTKEEFLKIQSEKKGK